MRSRRKSRYWPVFAPTSKTQSISNSANSRLRCIEKSRCSISPGRRTSKPKKRDVLSTKSFTIFSMRTPRGPSWRGSGGASWGSMASEQTVAYVADCGADFRKKSISETRFHDGAAVARHLLSRTGRALDLGHGTIHRDAIELDQAQPAIALDRIETGDIEIMVAQVFDRLHVARHVLVNADHRGFGLQGAELIQSLNAAVQHLHVVALGVDLQVGVAEAQSLAQLGEYVVERSCRDRLGVVDDVETLDPRQFRVIGCQERAELTLGGHVYAQGPGLCRQRIILDDPVPVALATLPEDVDVSRHWLEGDDQSCVEDALSQEIAILPGVGAHIEDAVDAKLVEELAEMDRKVPLTHVAQRHDFKAKRPRRLEDQVLDDLQHWRATGPPALDKRACRIKRYC